MYNLLNKKWIADVNIKKEYILTQLPGMQDVLIFLELSEGKQIKLDMFIVHCIK